MIIGYDTSMAMSAGVDPVVATITLLDMVTAICVDNHLDLETVFKTYRETRRNGEVTKNEKLWD